jgi:hypothetical protein
VQDLRAGGYAFVGVDLDVGQPRVVIDGNMEVVVADPTVPDLFAAAVHPPAAALGDAGELLDVDVQQIARTAAS